MAGIRQETPAGRRDLAFQVRARAVSLFTARFQLNSLKVKGPSNQEVRRNNLIQIFE